MAKTNILRSFYIYIIRLPIIREFVKEDFNICILWRKTQRKAERTIKRVFIRMPFFQALEREIMELRMAVVKNCSSKWDQEADYILQNGPTRYPYKKLGNSLKVESGYDNNLNLPYVIHKGKRLYYPKGFSLKKCENNYRSLVENDCILGGKFLEKQPHQYQSETFKIERGDVLADVGCAEALLALDQIDIINKAYLFESDKRWIPALKATFLDYNNKVEIVNKYVSDSDSTNTISLQTALKEEKDQCVFIKMDIEGAEVEVLNGSREYLNDNHHIKLAVCSYHHQDDEDRIISLLKEFGYHYEFSEGWMYFKGYDSGFRFPYFRHGIIRGWK